MVDSDTTTTCKDKRTNSLAFARSDCHTCASNGEKCDRRRPRCSTCLNRGRKCGGFPTTLSWDPKRMWSDNQSITNDDSTDLCNANTTMSDTARAEPIASRRAAPPRRFRFIKGPSRPRKQRRACLRGDKQARNQPVVQVNFMQEDDNITGEETIPRFVGENLDAPALEQIENNPVVKGKMDVWSFLQCRKRHS